LVCQWIASIGLDPELLRNALAAPNQGDTHLPPHWKPAGRAASARNNDKLPTNTRSRGGSTIRSIPGAARPY
jgi:hypothetical protein